MNLPTPQAPRVKAPLRRALVFINPFSRNGAQASEQATERLEKLGLSVRLIVQPDPSGFSELIEREATNIDIVVVGGGDGSINSVIGGLRKTRLPLGVLPLGTANNFARNLGLPLELEAACDVIANGVVDEIDLATVNGIPFFNVAGIGMSTDVNREIPKDFKKRWGPLAYPFFAARYAMRTRPFRAVIECDEARRDVRAVQVTVCNGQYYSAGLSIAPDASIDDGQLDVTIAQVEGLRGMLRILPNLWLGRPSARAGLHPLRGKRVRVRTRRPRPVDTDGEVLTQTPAEFVVVPKAIRVLRPTPKA